MKGALLIHADNSECSTELALLPSNPAIITSDESYYFALGQLLVHVFTVMGGIDRYRKEFNYLTNPSLAYPVQKLNSRIVHFLKCARERYELGLGAERFIDAVLAWQPGQLDEPRHIESLDDAFYSGLHAENVFSSSMGETPR